MNNRTYLLKFLGFRVYNLYINNLRREKALHHLNEAYDPGIINHSFSWDLSPEKRAFWNDWNYELENCEEETKQRNMLKIMII